MLFLKKSRASSTGSAEGQLSEKDPERRNLEDFWVKRSAVMRGCSTEKLSHLVVISSSEHKLGDW